MTDRAGSEALWMPLYVADYLKDTQHLSAQEHGAYLLLIMHAWTRGGLLPADEARLARIAQLSPKEWKASRDVILEFFVSADGGYRHKRVDQELARSDAKIEQRKAAGKASAAARATQRDGQRNGNERSTGDATNGQRNGRQSQSHTSLEHKGSNDGAASSDDPHAAFWRDAKAWLKPRVKGDPGALLNKWMRDHGKEQTQAAVNAAQVANAVDPPAYVAGYFRRHASAEGGLSVPC